MNRNDAVTSWNDSSFYRQSNKRGKKSVRELSRKQLVEDIDEYLKVGGVVDVVPPFCSPQVRPKTYPVRV